MSQLYQFILFELNFLSNIFIKKNNKMDRSVFLFYRLFFLKNICLESEIYIINYF